MLHLVRIVLVWSFLLLPAQTAFAQEPTQLLTPNVTCLDLDGSYVFSQEAVPTYLGFFGNQFASNSVMNRFGTYGSQFSSLSVRNQFSNFGSPFGTYSANNNISSKPPRILRNGSFVAYLTTNPVFVNGVSLATIDASCTFFSSSPVTDTPLPAAPTSVSASDGQYSDAIEVTWDPVPGADNYVLFRSESISDTLEFVAETSDTVYPVFEGTLGKVYWFWVAASSDSVLGELSEPDSGYIAPASSSFSLTVTKSGVGSGRILSSPGGIDCGSTCTAEYPESTVVTLTVTSDVGSTFAGWSGACIGKTPCVVTMNDAKTVAAEFAKDDDPPVDSTSKLYMPAVIR